MAFGPDGATWVADCMDGTVTRVDPASGEIKGAPIEVGVPFTATEPANPEAEDFSCPNALAVVGSTVWVSLSNDDTVVPIR
jgi:DNA-binding beta-propeller fold protein YncE